MAIIVRNTWRSRIMKMVGGSWIGGQTFVWNGAMQDMKKDGLVTKNILIRLLTIGEASMTSNREDDAAHGIFSVMVLSKKKGRSCW